MDQARAMVIIPFGIVSILSILILRSVAPSFAMYQAVYFLISLLLMILLSRLDYSLLTFSPWPWYGTAVVLLSLNLIIGQINRGAVRWITIGGVSLQTSEIAKPLLILFMAIYLAKHPPKTLRDICIFFAIVSVPALLILLQPDLGTTLIVLGASFFALIFAGAPYKYLVAMVVATLIISPVFFASLAPYQRQRIDSFINPMSDPRGAGYNALQATIAVGSGQLFGRGLGQGTQSHLRFLPERYSDFVFASLTEELGFLGGGILLAAYGVMLMGCIKIARHATSDSGSMLVLISASIVLAQVLINIGMNMGLLPITGITLPFMSAGGSSFISFAIILGLILAIGRTPAKKKHFLHIS